MNAQRRSEMLTASSQPTERLIIRSNHGYGLKERPEIGEGAGRQKKIWRGCEQSGLLGTEEGGCWGRKKLVARRSHSYAKCYANWKIYPFCSYTAKSINAAIFMPFHKEIFLPLCDACVRTCLLCSGLWFLWGGEKKREVSKSFQFRADSFLYGSVSIATSSPVS